MFTPSALSAKDAPHKDHSQARCSPSSNKEALPPGNIHNKSLPAILYIATLLLHFFL